MRVPLSWLDEWVPCRHLSVDELTDLFTHRGFPMESVERIGSGFENVVVGEVLEVARHPNADRLVLCKVNTGKGDPLSIVCGAPNVVAGMRAPVALVGAVLPGDRKIEKTTIRGQVSQGMLCSPKELLISDDHQGILRLPDDTPIGQPAGEALGVKEEIVIDLEVHYNRPDVMAVAGMARELAAALGVDLRSEPALRLGSSIRTGGRFPIRLEDPEGCPRYLGVVVRDVQIGPSPGWMQERLERAGVRPLFNVVDITNYVLLELGQPIHAFDLDRLAGPEIRVRRAQEGELLRTLDGRERTLVPQNLVIADRDRAVALAGVMGGEESEVTKTTRNILLESAYFDPYRVQVTANGLKLMTEASRRFGRGVDPNLPPVAAARAAQLLQEIAGGKVELPASEKAHRSFERLQLTLDPRKTSALLGVEIPAGEQMRSLRSLGFEVAGESPLIVLAPTHRGDIGEDVDLIEEVGRAYGYERLPDTPIGGGMQGPEDSPDWSFQQLVREALVGQGFTEVLTPSLGDPQKLALTWPLTRGAKSGEPSVIELTNPPSPRASCMRSDLAAGLLDVVARHLNHGAPSTRIFEIGRVFHPASAGSTATHEETVQIAFAISGVVDPGSWEGERDYDFYDAKGYAEALLERLGVDRPSFESYPSPAWKSGEFAELRATAPVGWVGCLEPRRAQAWKLEKPVFLFLATLAAVRDASHGATRFTAFSRFPGVKRDLAFFVPETVRHAEIVGRMRQSAGKLLQSVRLFDVYRGRGVPEDQKSLAYSLLFADPERTLQESEVESLQQRIVRTLADDLGATLRERPARG